MCGVVGVIGAPSRVNRQIFQDMLCLGAKRGPHSTGIAVATKKAAYLLKDVGLPWDLLRSKDYHENVVSKQWSVLMGHNRWATVGKVNVANAHPFWHGDTILMHNGTLEQGWNLEAWSRFDTDSECIAHNFNTHGVKETYKKMAGAWTLVWWDAKEGYLNAITNGMRPFNFIKTADGKAMYYASEEWIIRFAAEGRGIPLEKTCWTLTSHSLYKFFTNKKGTVDFTVEALEAKAPVPFKYPRNTMSHWEDDDNDAEIGNFLGYSASESAKTFMEGTPDGKSSGTNSTTGGSNVVVMGPKKGTRQVILLDDQGKPLPMPKEHPFGRATKIYKTVEEYKEKHDKDSCILCGCDVVDEYDDALVLDPETIACGTCHDFCSIQEPKVKLV